MDRNVSLKYLGNILENLIYVCTNYPFPICKPILPHRQNNARSGTAYEKRIGVFIESVLLYF